MDQICDVLKFFVVILTFILTIVGKAVADAQMEIWVLFNRYLIYLLHRLCHCFAFSNSMDLCRGLLASSSD